jgi:hypothetical protein
MAVVAYLALHRDVALSAIDIATLRLPDRIVARCWSCRSR